MKYAKYIIGIALCFNLVFGGIHTARAQAAVFDPIDFVFDVLSQLSEFASEGFNYITSLSTESLWLKEYFVDTALKVLANEAKQIFIEDTLSWMSNGFEGGGPLFVQNPTQYFSEVGDEASGALLAQLGNKINDDPDFFCRDFAPDIIFELGSYRRRDRFAGCTINDVAGNLERFTDNFESGGFENWFKIRNSSNNVIGFQLNLLDEQVARASARRADVKIETETGQGYKPVRECIEWEEVEAPISDENGQTTFEQVCKKYKTRTPGQAVADTIRPSISSKMDGLIAADELSELVGEIVDAAIQGAIRRGFDEVRN
ncbi:MAG: hypothetical protein AAB367_01295 [Patescibacteria group bacterium]